MVMSSEPVDQDRGSANEQTIENRMHHAVLHINHYGCPNTDVTREYADVRIDSISGAYVNNDRKKQLLKVKAETSLLDEFIEAYRAHDRVVTAEHYPHQNTAKIAHLSTVIDYGGLKSISQILADHGVYRGPTARAMAGSERWQAYFDSHADIGAVVEAIEAEGNQVTVEQKQVVDLKDDQTHRSPLSDLTPRQQEVFLAAIDQDYFAMNSDTNLESLADELDLSTSAVWEHLTRSKDKILTAVAEEVLE